MRFGSVSSQSVVSAFSNAAAGTGDYDQFRTDRHDFGCLGENRKREAAGIDVMDHVALA
jgi:hypothetical protein